MSVLFIVSEPQTYGLDKWASIRNVSKHFPPSKPQTPEVQKQRIWTFMNDCYLKQRKLKLWKLVSCFIYFRFRKNCTPSMEIWRRKILFISGYNSAFRVTYLQLGTIYPCMNKSLIVSQNFIITVNLYNHSQVYLYFLKINLQLSEP